MLTLLKPPSSCMSPALIDTTSAKDVPMPLQAKQLRGTVTRNQFRATVPRNQFHAMVHTISRQ
jgi:hypothetical protein